MFSSNVVLTLKPLPIFIQNLRSTPLFKNTKNMSLSNHFQNTWILNQVTFFFSKTTLDFQTRCSRYSFSIKLQSISNYLDFSFNLKSINLTLLCHFGLLLLKTIFKTLKSTNTFTRNFYPNYGGFDPSGT
jgi:hypothetical protein